MSAPDPTIRHLNIVKEIEIAAPIEVAFQALLDELGPEGQMPDGTPMPFKLEPWPGGRLYRDLGDNNGHFWAHVQVIKAPKLLEMVGPMFMSFPATSHLQYRLVADGAVTRLTLTHRAFGLIPQEMQEQVTGGWSYKLNRVAELAKRRASR